MVMPCKGWRRPVDSVIPDHAAAQRPARFANSASHATASSRTVLQSPITDCLSTLTSCIHGETGSSCPQRHSPVAFVMTAVGLPIIAARFAMPESTLSTASSCSIHAAVSAKVWMPGS